MTVLRYDPAFLDDLGRIEHHLRAHDAADIAERIVAVFDALDMLSAHPMIGRAVSGGRRELVIGRGSRGYVALYRYDPLDDGVVILGVRAQRELGFDEAG